MPILILGYTPVAAVEDVIQYDVMMTVYRVEDLHGINEIAKEIGVDETELVQAFEASVMPESLYAKVNIGGKGDSDGVRLLDIVADNDTEEKITDRVFLRQSLEILSERERKIIVLRYFKGKTQCEISELIGVSQVQVSRLEKKAIEKMRSLL